MTNPYKPKRRRRPVPTSSQIMRRVKPRDRPAVLRLLLQASVLNVKLQKFGIDLEVF